MDEAKVQQDMTLIQQLMNFWLDLLRTEVESCGNTAVVHQVMRQNLGLVVSALGQVIVQWTQAEIAQNPA